MSNFWVHTSVNVFLFSLLAIYLASHGFFWVDVTLFWLHAMFHTAISCDIDTPSIPTKLLGIVGCYQSAIYEVQSKEYCHECMFSPESEKCKNYTRRNNRAFLLR